MVTRESHTPSISSSFFAFPEISLEFSCGCLSCSSCGSCADTGIWMAARTQMTDNTALETARKDLLFIFRAPFLRDCVLIRERNVLRAVPVLRARLRGNSRNAYARG